MADMFDAMTSNRVYQKSQPVYKALEAIMADCVYKLDRDVYQAFVESINIYPEGTLVTLSGNLMAMIMSQNIKNPSRPIVKVLQTDEIRDLSKELAIFVEDVIT